MPSGYAQTDRVIGRVTTPFRSLPAIHVPRIKPKRKVDKNVAAPCTYNPRQFSWLSNVIMLSIGPVTSIGDQKLGMNTPPPPICMYMERVMQISYR